MNTISIKEEVTNSLISKEIFGKTLLDLGKSDERIVVCEADLMRASGTQSFMEKYPDRHFNFGVAEQNCMAASAGLALSGKTVFATTFANFASKRACDQVSISIAYNKANVKVCGTYAGLTSEKNGGTHISVEDISIMRAMPNMRVVEPADSIEFASMTKVLAEYNGPVYFRQPKRFFSQVFKDSYNFEFGKGVELTKGKDITIISCGIMTGLAYEAIKDLNAKGVSVKLINMSSIKPIDSEIIIKAAEETKAILTLENHSIIGGLGSAVAEVLAEKNIDTLFKISGIRDVFGETADLEWQLRKNHLFIDDITETVLKMLSNK